MQKAGGEELQMKTKKALGSGKSPEHRSRALCGGPTLSNLTATGTRTTSASWIGLDSRGMMLLAHTECTPYVNIKTMAEMVEVISHSLRSISVHLHSITVNIVYKLHFSYWPEQFMGNAA